LSTNDSPPKATTYKDILGLEYIDCNACSVEDWIDALRRSEQEEAKEKLSRYGTFTDLIQNARIFSSPSHGQGYYDVKPERYLAIAFVESRMTRGEEEQAISTLQNSRSLF
jgi:hypothetical protein